MSDDSSMAMEEDHATSPPAIAAADPDAADSHRKEQSPPSLPATLDTVDTHSTSAETASSSATSSHHSISSLPTPQSTDIPPSPTNLAASSSSARPPTATASEAASSHSIRRLPAFDDCCICFNGDSEDNDPILFCDGPNCTAVVHQSCYGILSIPEGDWLCESCTLKANPSLAATTPLLLTNINRCMLCPDTNGAFKPTADGRGWVHASCAIWTPETGFNDAEKVDTVIGIETIDRRRWRLVCEICRVKQGSCVQCMGRQCSFSCHVTCGWKSGLRMEMQAVGTGDDLEVYKLVFCDKHRHEPWQKVSGRYGRGRTRAVRPNDEGEAAGTASGRSDNPKSGYQCVRCGSRRRQHDCKRDAMDDVIEAEDEEEEDGELLQLWEDRNERETFEERMEREEDERDMERLWESERQQLDREREEKRRQDKERREKDREERLARGEGTLYEEMRQAQEEAEVKYALGDGLDSYRPVSTTKRRKRREREPPSTAVDGEWKEEKAPSTPTTSSTAQEKKEADDGTAEETTAAKKRIGRPAGSQTRIRRCPHHRELKEQCARSCPFRPPPFTEAELKARADERERRGPRGGGGRREVKRKMEDAMRMTTSAPGQRKVIRQDINGQLGSGQQTPEKKEQPSLSASSTASSSHSTSPGSIPLSSLNALPPPPFSHPIAPSAIVSNPITAPPAPVLQPLGTSAALVVPRPNAPFIYNTRDHAELSRRIQSLLAASTPDQQRLQLKQLLSDSPPSYCRLVTTRLREVKAEAVLLHWLREGREHKAWALIQEVLSALSRLVTAVWDERVAAGVIQEVLMHREGVSEGCKREANGVWKRLVEIGWVKEAVKTELKSRDAFNLALQAGQLNGVLNATSGAPVNGAGGSGGDKRTKVVKLPAFTNGDSNNHTASGSNNHQLTNRVSFAPAFSANTATQPSRVPNNTARPAAVGMTSERYRQKAMQEAAEKAARDAQREKELDYQARIAAAAAQHYPPSSLHQPQSHSHAQHHSHVNGGWNPPVQPLGPPLSQYPPPLPSAVDPFVAISALNSALNSQLFASTTSNQLPPSFPTPLDQSLATAAAAAASLSAAPTTQFPMADVLQVAAMLQHQLEQREGGLGGAMAGLQALDGFVRSGAVHSRR